MMLTVDCGIAPARGAHLGVGAVTGLSSRDFTQILPAISPRLSPFDNMKTLSPVAHSISKARPLCHYVKAARLSPLNKINQYHLRVAFDSKLLAS
jgi:hypothetical protein